ncbi:adenine deaminase [Flavobacterium psychrophilum]|nr:adenine deaminase [Flavobacterium psychrophilum]
MIENGKQVPLKFHFGAPSCVPATAFETAGAIIDSEEIKELMASPDIYYLSEMMNYPGVLFDDDEVLKKLLGQKISTNLLMVTHQDCEENLSKNIFRQELQPITSALLIAKHKKNYLLV